MLYEEYQKAIGNESLEEFELAEKFYLAMPETFTKEDLFSLRKAMSKGHFMHLCKIVSNHSEEFESFEKENRKLKSKSLFVDEMIDTLSDKCNIDVVGTYAAYKADLAMKDMRENIYNIWKEVCGAR